MTAQALYAAMLKERISPALRSLGLAGSGGRYSMKSESHWALIGFQKSAYSDRSEVRFTVNLLVVSRADWATLSAERSWNRERPAAGTYYGPRVANQRLGALVGSHEDKWWRVYAGQDMDLVASEVIGDLANVGLPWLQARIST